MELRRLIPALLCCCSATACIIHIDADDGWNGSYVRSYRHESRLRGSGTMVTETRTVEPFQRLSLRGGHLDAHVRVGSAQSLTIRGDSELLSRLETSVSDQTLVVDLEPEVDPRQAFELTIEVPELRSIEISGSASAAALGLASESFELVISGSGAVQVSGSAGALTTLISGSGQADLSGLAVREAHVRVTGSGNLEIDASERLDVEISGSGSVLYRGSPTVSSRISGSGTVSNR